VCFVKLKRVITPLSLEPRDDAWCGRDDCDFVGRQDGPASRPSASGGPGFNQVPHQTPYPPPQSHGGQTTGLSYSASTSASYNNATASWKKPQTGVMGLAKDTVDKFAGKETRKNVQSSMQSACFLCFCPLSSCVDRWVGGLGLVALPPLVHPRYPPSNLAPAVSPFSPLIRLKHPSISWADEGKRLCGGTRPLDVLKPFMK